MIGTVQLDRDARFRRAGVPGGALIDVAPIASGGEVQRTSIDVRRGRGAGAGELERDRAEQDERQADDGEPTAAPPVKESIHGTGPPHPFEVLIVVPADEIRCAGGRATDRYVAV